MIFFVKKLFLQKKLKELSDLMGPVLEQYKFQLQGKKNYKLVKTKSRWKLGHGVALALILITYP